MRKYSVGLLGATGIVGQRFIELLADHPWFEITAVAASAKSVNKEYRSAVQWKMSSSIPEKVARMRLCACLPNLACDFVFSALPNTVAKQIEASFVDAGYLVISNASAYRLDRLVPLLVPEVNSAHLKLLAKREHSKGAIVTNPNCSVTGIVIALKPLIDIWGIETVNVTTLQALSGAGYPGISSLDICDNVIPFIEGEEEKIETEPLKIFGDLQEDAIVSHPMRISAHCTRVPVTDGHLACISVKLCSRASAEQIVRAWELFKAES